MKKLLPLLLIVCLLTACAPANKTNKTPPDTGSNVTQNAPQPPADTTPTDTAPAPIAPLPSVIDLNNLTDCTLFISFDESGISTDADGRVQLTASVYDYELFDMVDMAALEVGSTILLRGEEVSVTALERLADGTLLINGGVFEGGYELATDEDTVFREVRENDHREFYLIGEITLPLSADFVLTDNADLDNTGLTFNAAALARGEVPWIFTFSPLNTTARIAGGEIVSMERRYIP